MRIAYVLLLSILAGSCCARIRSSEPIVGHILPHSHCDAAYKKTVDEYYETQVRNVLNSFLIALSDSPNRRFVWAETIFLTKWWHDARTTHEQRQKFGSLLASEQLELVCGGWVMHDEAITRYDSQIHQMTHGHDMLTSLFGNAPHLRTGYQIDPFGPASFTVLLHKWAGFDMLLHNRIAHKELWRKNQSLEFMWEVNDEALWVHVYDTHYETPGFDWESLEVPSAHVTPANVQERTDDYMTLLREKAGYYKTPHVLIPFGGDFRFQNASLQFSNMDQIVNYANAHPERYRGDSLKYSTVHEYHEAIQQNYVPNNFPVVTGSPFITYWTGYYTTLPAVKQMVRACEIILRAVEIHALQRDLQHDVLKQIQSVRETVYLMQHHDAITGTSYRFVILDYMKRMKRALDTMTQILSMWLLENDDDEKCRTTIPGKVVGGGPYLHETLLVRGTEDAHSIHLDRILDPMMGMDDIPLVVLNSLAWSVATLVSFVSSRSDIAILQGSTPVQSQATPLEDELDVANLGLFLVTFQARIPPFGKTNYQVKVCDLTWDTFQDPPIILPSLQCAKMATKMTEDEVFRDGISSHEVHVQFDSETKDISAVVWTTKAQLSLSLSHDIILYEGTNDTVYTVYTAAKDSDPTPLPKTCRIVSAYKGPMFSQVTVEFNPWLRARYRVVHVTDMASFLQVSVLSGPLPSSVNVASRFQTNLTTTSAWFYDESGFKPVKATYDSAEDLGSSIRPMVSRSWLQEVPGHSSIPIPRRFTVFTVDPRGVVSRHPCSLDIFWQRRNNGTLDWLKQGEDISTVRSSIWLNLAETEEVSSDDESDILSHRSLATVLANDITLVSLEDQSTPRKWNATIEDLLPKHMHVVSFRKSGRKLAVKDNEMTADGSDEAWIDVQIENLSEDPDLPQDVKLVLLLQNVANAAVEHAVLRSLTFLYDYDAADFTNQTLGACRLRAGNDGEFLLRVGIRHICSVRIPLHSPQDYESYYE